ncbi:uncharacterized protein [Dysidea avara]|uniref:uncharacterized protein isoform X2 n=1 Tax=Dysidea avara TaxID=196820 RepID=UPI003333474B
MKTQCDMVVTIKNGEQRTLKQMEEQNECRSPRLEEVGKMTEVDVTTEFNKMATVDGPPHSFQAQQLSARANTVPTNLTSQMSTDDDAFHHLAVQLNLIDTEMAVVVLLLN